MSWHLDISRRAGRELDQLPATDRDAILAALQRLLDDPSSVDFRKLAGTQSGWRLRVGRWRVLVELDTHNGLMTVARVLDRRDAYRG